MSVSGGYNGNSFLNIVEIYDPAKDQWELGVPMSSGRSGHASAVSYQHCLSQVENNTNSEKEPSWHKSTWNIIIILFQNPEESIILSICFLWNMSRFNLLWN